MGIFDFLGLGRPPARPATAGDASAAARPAANPLVTPPPAPSEAELRAEANEIIDAYIADLERIAEPDGFVNPQRARYVPSAPRVADAPLPQRIRMLRLARERTAPDSGEPLTDIRGDAFCVLMDVLIRYPVVIPAADLLPLVERAARPSRPPRPGPDALDLASAAGRTWREQPDAPEILRPALQALYKFLRTLAPVYTRRQAVERISELLTGSRVPPGWADRVLRAVEEMEPGRRGLWRTVYAHLHGASSTTPSARWLKQARALRDQVGRDELRATLLEWLPWMREDADYPLPPGSGDLARGWVWVLADGGGDAEARIIGDLALIAAQVVTGSGLRSVKLLGACMTALGQMDTDEALAQVSRVRARAKHVQARRMVETALHAAAGRRGMEPEELEEIVVPTFGMDEPGVLREEFDGWTAEVRVTGTTDVETVWVRADGKRQKSAPAEVRAEHADEVKALKATAAEMEKMLAAQRERLEALPMAERVLPFPAWRERYLDHPLLAQMCRRLTWRFETDGRAASGAWLDGVLVDADDAPLEGLGAETVVRPWHPVHAAADEVGAWRAWLDRHGVTQPFKQAHREIYVLTEAEREMRLFSNRFAGHFLKQHVFSALARGRGWRHHPILWGRPRGEFPFPSLLLERYGLLAEYAVAGVNDLGDTSRAMTAYVTTDQVRFAAFDGGLEALEDVPPLVLSEVFRDVDLFVGVASVAADPDWAEREHEHEPAAYWRMQAFGELSATALTRRDVLARLLPRLRIADRCTLEDRFLVVRGTRRTYRIHMGSGNILMEPNAQYLCIVPAAGARDAAAGVVLPFEGDSTLAVILSKAFLLADDAKITDRVILAQILHR
jgi:hypothetical protein